MTKYMTHGAGLLDGGGMRGMASLMRETFVSLRNRNFKLFFYGQTISNTGNWLTSVALTLLVLKVTESGFAVGVLAACQYGPILLFSAWAGTVADRFDKHALLYATQGLEMAQSAGLAVFAFLPHPPLVGLYALALFGGILLSLDNPLRRSFVSEMVAPEDVPNAVVLYSTTVNVARVFGPALAGALIVSIGYGWCFTIDALSYLAVLWSLYQMRTNELHRAAQAAVRGGSVREGLRYIRATPVFLVNFIMLALIGTLTLNFTVTLPLFVTRSLGAADGVFTVLYSIFSVGAIAGSFLIARREDISVRHVVAGAAAFGLAVLALSAAPNVWSAIGIAFFVGASSVIYSTATTTLIQVDARPEMRGRALALQSVFFIGSTAIGGPALGYLADVAGGRMPLVVGGVVCLAAAAYGAYAMHEGILGPGEINAVNAGG